MDFDEVGVQRLLVEAVAAPSSLASATLVAVRTVPQRELRNDIARVLREVDAGETVQITVRGQVVAEMRPPRRRQLTPTAAALALLAKPADPMWLAELLADREGAEADERDLWS